MKNNRRLSYDSNGSPRIEKNRNVKMYLRGQTAQAERQWREQGFGLLQKPLRIAVYVRLVFYGYNPARHLPKSDGDNAYTTIQEMLQGIAIEDDNQVGAAAWEVKYTQERSLEHAQAIIWRLEDDIPFYLQIKQAQDCYFAKSDHVKPDTLGVPALIREALSSLLVQG